MAEYLLEFEFLLLGNLPSARRIELAQNYSDERLFELLVIFGQWLRVLLEMRVDLPHQISQCHQKFEEVPRRNGSLLTRERE